MNKKAILGIVVSIILVVTAVEVVGFLQSQTPHCSVDPYDTSCFCYEDEIRTTTLVDDRVFATCNPTTPTDFEPPIETWEEAMEFVEYNFGTSQCTCGLKADCDQSDMWLESPLRPHEAYTETGPIPEEFMDSLIELRCMHVLEWYDPATKTSPHSLAGVWGIMFIPRSGNIWERWCSSDYMVDCPSRIRPFSIINLIF